MRIQLADEAMIRRLLPPRSQNTHKGHYGRALLVCGAVGYTGAAYFAAQSAVCSGDVLAGMIIALLAQGLNPFEASAAAVYLHGLAGDLARKKLGETGMTPTDMLQLIPQAFYQCRGV